MPSIDDFKARLRDNGPRWTIYNTLGTVFRSLAAKLDGKAAQLEERRGLPGINHIHRNRQKWDQYGWADAGEEWTPSPEWKAALLSEVMQKYVPEGGTVLEIGPGAGRWTEHLQSRAGHLIMADLSTKCIEICRERFAHADNVEFHVNSGADLRFLENDSIDSVWSFDVFVHVSGPETQSYVTEIGRVLRPGGRALIHHPNRGGGPEGFRSRMTGERFVQFVGSAGMVVVSQFDSWGPDGRYDVRRFCDTITVFEKPRLAASGVAKGDQLAAGPPRDEI